MRSISILTLAALTLAACETTPTQTEIGQVEEIEQSESTDTVGEIVEDTQEDETDVVESEEIECEFEVLTAEGGEAIMANTISVENAQGAASGSQEPSEELRAIALQFNNDDPECGALTVESARFLVVWTDKADTGWQPQDIWGMDRYGNVYEAEVSDMGGLLFVDFDLDYQIEAGDYGLFAVMIDTLGASTELDDQVRVDLYQDSLVVNDGAASVTLEHEGVGGETIVF
ncbi:hypothetical protein CO174_00800 [Candidatus Uhrbacteria bacterium CG_4_9_14_3_um_filter_50_9]|uniref:Uncharacterized protein n=1 Tax=Candidatus Uhrbacteria bacterium CG_4_9_14_3_um_filter_50_9 TaxID=1975035 RepID=A0A2M7XE98_9BACT|nr:MAG: hypothetical protein CO174_00800 [Candidatus Uhrbacteria bacterium CG_4_9_14_3_um_filter_50_9]